MSELMKQTLDKCFGKIKLGIITNGPAEHQKNKIRALGLMQWIPEECIFVGDSFDNDVAGAKNAGWKAVWFNRRNRVSHGELTPDFEVRTEKELQEILLHQM